MHGRRVRVAQIYTTFTKYAANPPAANPPQDLGQGNEIRVARVEAGEIRELPHASGAAFSQFPGNDTA
jgi:hypothetical protein